MHRIGLPSAVFLTYLLAVLPWAAWRSARVFNAPPAPDGAGTVPARSRIYLSTTAMLAVLFLLARFTGGSFGSHLFELPALGVREITAGLAALLFQYVMMWVNRSTRTPEEIRAMPVMRLIPRGARERTLFSINALAAGVAEEAAYRGVLMAILAYALGNGYAAALIAATAFAFGHALQGRRSMLVIFVMALSMHLLVWFTQTLVIAMAVHAAYDLSVPWRARRWLAAPR